MFKRQHEGHCQWSNVNRFEGLWGHKQGLDHQVLLGHGRSKDFILVSMEALGRF